LWGSTGRLVAEKAFTPKAAEQPVITLENQGEKHSEQQAADNHFIKILLEFHRSIENYEFEKHMNELLSQSKLLTNIREVAHKFYV
jgi:hypothetical protein